MATIAIEQAVLIRDDIFRKVRLDIVKEGVHATLTGSGNDSSQIITWEQLEDVEYLADVFNDELVKVFKVAITMLGKVSDNKDLYLGMV